MSARKASTKKPPMQCAQEHCKNEETAFTKKNKATNKKMWQETNPDIKNRIYIDQFDHASFKNMNNCYAKHCPEYIRYGLRENETFANSICTTEKENKKFKAQMCRFVAEVKKILNKTTITGDDKTLLHKKLTTAVVKLA